MDRPILRNGIAAALAGVLALPAGWLLAMSMTPLLWRLEPVLHRELAGHSGPSDWIFYCVWVCVWAALFAIFRWIMARRHARRPE